MKIDRLIGILSGKEMQANLTGLKSLDSISGNHQYAQMMENDGKNHIGDKYMIQPKDSTIQDQNPT